MEIKANTENLPSRELVDAKIIEIMDENLEIINGTIGFRFTASLNILNYFEELLGFKFDYKDMSAQQLIDFNKQSDEI